MAKKKFEVFEQRIHTLHDSPVVGASTEREKPKVSQGASPTKEGALTILHTLVGKYAIEGWKVSSSESKPDSVSLYDETFSEDIIIWIEEV